MADRTLRTPPTRARTRDWTPRFLEALGRDPRVSEAARQAGIGRRTVYDRRSADPEFAAAWDDVIAGTLDELEAEAYRRAVNGSDQLLMFLLRARRPKVYSERYRIQHSGHIDGARPMLDLHDPEVRAASRELLHAVAAARSARLAKEAKS